MKDGRSQYRQFRNMVFNDIKISREEMKTWVKEAICEKINSIVTEGSIEKTIEIILSKWNSNSTRNIAREIEFELRKQMKGNLTTALKNKVGELISQKITISLTET